MERKPKGVKCPAIDGLISEADEVVGEVADKEVLDAAIVGAAQSVEHYEIARYGTLIAWAEALGHDDIIRLLNTTLNEEKAADKIFAIEPLRSKRPAVLKNRFCTLRSSARWQCLYLPLCSLKSMRSCSPSC